VDALSWVRAGGEIGAVHLFGQVLVVPQTIENQHKVAALLRMLRRHHGALHGIRAPSHAESLFTPAGHPAPWVLGLLRRAADGTLSAQSSVRVRGVAGRTLARIGGVWFDTALTKRSRVVPLRWGSAAAAAVQATPAAGQWFALGWHVVVAAGEERAVCLTAAGLEDATAAPVKALVQALQDDDG